MGSSLCTSLDTKPFKQTQNLPRLDNGEQGASPLVHKTLKHKEIKVCLISKESYNRNFLFYMYSSFSRPGIADF